MQALTATAFRQIWFVFVGLYAAAWVVLLTDVTGIRDEYLSDIAQVLMNAIAAILLWRSACSSAPALGPGTKYAALGMTVMGAVEVWWTVSQARGADDLQPLNYFYGLASVFFTAAAAGASRGAFWPRSRASRGRILVDVVLLGASAVLLWRKVVSGRNESADLSSLPMIGLSFSDSIFVVIAIMAWVHAEKRRRRALRLLTSAALIIYATDAVYASSLPLNWHSQGKLLDAGWALAATVIAQIAISGPVRSRRRIPGLSRWIGACLSPLAALAVLMLAAIGGEGSEGFPGIDYVFLTLAFLIVLRQVFFAAEQFVLVDRIEAASREHSYQADHDDLTGVLARRAFLARAGEVVRRRRDNPSGQLGLLWLDVDDFKRVNDTFGHSAGDQVLQAVASRLKQASRRGDIVGRLGGDEFVVLRPALNSSAISWAEHLARVVSTPIEVGGATVRVACSAGVVRSDGSDELDDLIVDGDLALLDAKRSGRGRVVEFTSTITDLLSDARLLADYVRNVVQRGDIIVRYQPIIDFEKNRIVGAEALTRIVGPHGQELLPSDFLHLVELQGLLPKLFDLVLDRALSDFAPLNLRVSINVASSDITAPGFADRVGEALRRHDMVARRLVLELNERVTPQRRVLESVRTIEALGVRFALDDFGTKWSHLDQVRALTPAFVKLDRDLVATASRPGTAGGGMLYGTVALAKSFGAKLIAEGIETEAQAISARNAGADLGQGWYWAKDLTIDELIESKALTGQPKVLPRVL